MLKITYTVGIFQQNLVEKMYPKKVIKQVKVHLDHKMHNGLYGKLRKVLDSFVQKYFLKKERNEVPLDINNCLLSICVYECMHGN